MIPAFPTAMPVAGFGGGLLIGIAAAVLLLGLGRIAGVSGLAARGAGIAETGPPQLVALAFVIGLPFGAFLVSRAYGVVETHFPISASPLVIGGLLVGFGTRLGSGCTSGHGVCGMSRLSIRSIVATMIFMAAGIVTVAVLRAASLA